jgi:hypothetical protein
VRTPKKAPPKKKRKAAPSPAVVEAARVTAELLADLSLEDQHAVMAIVLRNARRDRNN